MRRSDIILATLFSIVFLANPSTATAAVHTIRMTGSGFEPARLEVMQDDLVQFVNEDTTPRWVASDEHPTHTQYPNSDVRTCDTSKDDSPGFDSCRPLAQGSEYAFRFSHPGTWSFHDHIDPGFTGEIVVEAVDGQPLSAQSAVVPTATLSLPGKILAWFVKKRFDAQPEQGKLKLAQLNMIEVSRSDAALEYWMRIFGHEAMLTELLKDAEDPTSRPNSPSAQVLVGECHTPAHFVGRMAYKLYGLSALQEGLIDTRCQFGFYHGVIESSLGETGDDAIVLKFVEACREYQDNPLRRIFCEHVIGHGLMVQHNYDLPTAIKKCHDLISYEPGRRMCYHGAFMENAFVTFGFGVGGHTTTWVDSKRPNFPCDSDALPDDGSVRDMCYFNQSLFWSPFGKGFDAQKAIQGCLQIPESSRSRCFVGLGFNIALPMAALQDVAVAKACTSAPRKRDQRDCLLGALFMRATHWHTFVGFKNEALCSALGYKDLEACDKGVIEEYSWIWNVDI